MSRQTQTPGTALHAAAGRHLGTREWPGARHNSVVLKYFRDAGVPWPMTKPQRSCRVATACSACRRFCAMGAGALDAGDFRGRTALAVPACARRTGGHRNHEDHWDQ